MAAATMTGVARFCSRRLERVQGRGATTLVEALVAVRCAGVVGLFARSSHLVGLVDVGTNIQEELGDLDEAETCSEAQGRVAILRTSTVGGTKQPPGMRFNLRPTGSPAETSALPSRSVLTSSTAKASAPLASSSLTTSMWPLMDAVMIGVSRLCNDMGTSEQEARAPASRRLRGRSSGAALVAHGHSICSSARAALGQSSLTLERDSVSAPRPTSCRATSVAPTMAARLSALRPFCGVKTKLISKSAFRLGVLRRHRTTFARGSQP